MSVDRVLAALEAAGAKPVRSGSGWLARCPAHDDRDPSLGVDVGNDGRVLLACHAGCRTEDVLAALGLDWDDLFADGPEPRPSPTWVSTVPVPEDAPAPQPHPKLGRSTSRWSYRDAAGRLLGWVCRWDSNPHKELRPLTWGRLTTEAPGSERWGWQSWSGPAPLYGLELLAARPEAPVLVVEGEKAADAARALFTDYVVVTSPGGASRAHRADWTPLAGRDVTCWPDADPAGHKYAEHVAELAHKAGAASVRIVPVPEDWPVGWDLADAPPDGVDLRAMLEAVTVQPEQPTERASLRNCQSEPQPSKPGDAVVSLRALYENPELLRPPTAIVPGLAYRGRLVMLAGPEKSGKSTLLGWAASAVSSGGGFAAHRLDRGRVLWVGLEEPLADAVQRFKAAGADPDLVDVLSCLPHGHEELFAAIREHLPVWVVLDSLIRWGELATPAVTDWAQSAQAAPLVNKLADLCHQTDLGITVTHHTRRIDGRYRDSSAIGAAVDLIDEMSIDAGRSPNPNVRHVKPIGRFTVDPFSLVKTPVGFFPAEGDGGSLRDRVLAHIRHNPGCSRKSVCRGVEGRTEATMREIDRLLEDRWIEDHQTAVGSRLYLLSDAVALEAEGGREPVGTGPGTGQIVAFPESGNLDGNSPEPVGTGDGNRCESGRTATPLTGGSREPVGRSRGELGENSPPAHLPLDLASWPMSAARLYAEALVKDQGVPEAEAMVAAAAKYHLELEGSSGIPRPQPTAPAEDTAPRQNSHQEGRQR